MWEYKHRNEFLNSISDGERKVGVVYNEQDAKLIAAAPEMYEALRSILEEIPIIAGDSRHLQA